MDINTIKWSQKEFIDMACFCVDKDSVMCKRTGYACKDYMCPIVKAARSIEDVKKAFENQQ